MSLDKKFLLKALLQYNYFPSQKKEKEEVPPILNSKCLTPEISEELIKLDNRKNGYDQVEYKLTRYNNVPRSFNIPHPLPYARLCHSLHENWENIEYILQTENSLAIPEKYKDGRIIIMDYEKSKKQIERHIKLSFNKKFYVNADISNFYPSIYSHSISWALVGFEKAKEGWNDKNEWFNQIDKYQRSTKRNETNGIPIGPATSNIIAELILARIDKKLKDEKFVFIRFIDDYTAYVDTYGKAEDFIRRLSEELSRYKLLLNIKKTFIEQLPSPASSEWMVDLTTRIPDKGNISPTNILRFLDYAVTKQAMSPDGSILKYAAKTIIKYDVEDDTAELILRYLLSLCIKYPILLPLLDILFGKISFDSGFPYTDQLLMILKEHAINKRSDAMTWSLYYLNDFSQPIPKEIAENAIKSEDCISILFLYLSEQYDDEIIAFCDNLYKSDLFTLDQYWLLLYQLFFDRKITNPYNNDKTAYNNHLKSKADTPENAMDREIQVFNTLKSNGVSFIESRARTIA
ncbi:MAG: Reverse transcriptase (RNA-dependent DNA polymerase) [Candidatus Syntrophoarchaeum sp. GoM_oil]|nr:MAG: Reverse transcriptase (RNA-dependent DNA polymerase) [Candidatus Syntrophoarchaeum sp. GoM_oil]